MEFSCDKTALENAVINALRGVSSRSTLQVLEGVLLTADKDKLSVCGYDLKTGIKCSVPAAVKEPGTLVVNARSFADIIRKLPEETVTVATGSDSILTIRCGLSEFNVIALSADEFPELPEVDLSFCVKLPGAKLKSMISETIFAVSENEARPIHTGSRFSIENGVLEIVSVDGYRLAVRSEPIETISPDIKCQFVVPATALREVERIAADDEDQVVTIYPDNKFILFDMDGILVITRLLEGEFLNYKKAVPEDTVVSYTADIKELLSSVDRVSVIVNEKLKNPIRCFFDDNVVRLSCTTATGRAYDECRLEGRGTGIEIGFNSRYLQDALRACPDDQAVISLKSGLSPCVIRPVEGESFLYLVLPVRLKTNE